MQPSTYYLLYAEDGSTLVYAGPDEAEYERLTLALAPQYAGSLVGRRSMGREQWVVRSLFRAQPDPQFISRRRHGFPYGFMWEGRWTRA